MSLKDSTKRLAQHGVLRVPSRWRQSRVKYLGRYINGYPFKPDDWGDVGRPILRIQNLTDQNADCNRYSGEIPFEYIVRKGDILISWSASLGVSRWLGEESWLNQHIFKVEIDRARVRDDYFVWLANWFMAELERDKHGSTMQHLTADAFGGFPVLLPPFPVQEYLANYLDRETCQIDKLVAAKEKVLALMDEKRRALITHAVTRGLNPKAPLRNSGIPWLGQIPRHWETKRSKWIFTERDERSTKGEEVLLSLRMEKGLVPHNDVSEKQTTPEELIGYKKTSVGEIVINRMRASSGLIAITPQEGLVSPDYAVFRVSSDVSPNYFSYLFTTELLQGVFRSESTGLGTGSSGFLRLYSENFLSLWFPSPHIDEQRAIVDYIETETGKLDALRAATERTVALLRERRAALIAAVVTGQIQIRG